MGLQGGSHAVSKTQYHFNIMGDQVSEKERGGNQKAERGPAGTATAPTPPHVTVRKAPSQTGSSALTCLRITDGDIPGPKRTL